MKHLLQALWCPQTDRMKCFDAHPLQSRWNGWAFPKGCIGECVHKKRAKPGRIELPPQPSPRRKVILILPNQVDSLRTQSHEFNIENLERAC